MCMIRRYAVEEADLNFIGYIRWSWQNDVLKAPYYRRSRRILGFGVGKKLETKLEGSKGCSWKKWLKLRNSERRKFEGYLEYDSPALCVVWGKHWKCLSCFFVARTAKNAGRRLVFETAFVGQLMLNRQLQYCVLYSG